MSNRPKIKTTSRDLSLLYDFFKTRKEVPVIKMRKLISVLGHQDKRYQNKKHIPKRVQLSILSALKGHKTAEIEGMMMNLGILAMPDEESVEDSPEKPKHKERSVGFTKNKEK